MKKRLLNISIWTFIVICITLWYSLILHPGEISNLMSPYFKYVLGLIIIFSIPIILIQYCWSKYIEKIDHKYSSVFSYLLNTLCILIIIYISVTSFSYVFYNV